MQSVDSLAAEKAAMSAAKWVVWMADCLAAKLEISRGGMKVVSTADEMVGLLAGR